MSDRKHLCILPFMHASAKQTGQSRYCTLTPDRNKHNVMTKTDGSPYNLGGDSLDDIWNSEHAKDMRKLMLSGKQAPGCEFCWKEEAVGKQSKRLRENRKYYERYKHYVDYAEQNDGRLDDNLPVYLDLRPGNLCNLKCRMCGPIASSLFAKEVIEEWDPELLKDPRFVKYKKTKILIEDWFTTDTFWENINRMLPNMEHIYITGGEPTVIKQIMTLLELCVETGYAKNIHLRFSTNAMSVNPKLSKIFKHFKEVEIGVSIDAYGDKLTYLRNPITWDIAEANLLKYLNMTDNVNVSVDCCISLMNILYLDELFTKFKELGELHNKKIYISPSFLQNPVYLHSNLLPEKIKKEARRRMEAVLPSLNFDQYQTDALMRILGMMDETPDDLEQKIIDFNDYTDNLDNIRNENFIETFPELRELKK